jgi:Avidin family
MSLAGVWQNEYGSQMTLSAASPNLVVGEYTSSTGSSGTYKVIGWQQSGDPTPQSGQAVALAIEWHSIVAGPPDNSWHWVSGLSGQISIQNGVEQLVLAHALVASVDFPGLAPSGTYVDKLIYKRVSAKSPPAEFAILDQAGLDDPMVGSWFADDATALLVQSVVPYSDNAFGWITGKLIWNGSPSMLFGVTDINATADGLNLQSVAVVGLPSDDGGPAISLSGTLDLQSGTLTLLDLQSASTAPNATYVQTAVSTKIFTKTS